MFVKLDTYCQCCVLAGSELLEMLDAVSQHIVIIISADLAHTHQASGPYGYSNASEPFDMVCFLVRFIRMCVHP